MRSLKYILVTSLLLSYCISNAQLKKFPEDKELFTQELNNIFGKSKKEEVITFLTETKFAWDSILSDEEKDKMITISNKLLARKARITPHVVNYIKTYLLFRNHSKAQENLKTWEEGILFMIKKKKGTLKNINDYFNVTTNLLNSNTLYSTPTVKWTSSNDQFKFVLDKTVKIVFKETNLTCYALRDSINIFETTGEFYPMEKIWRGSEGIVTWERSGYSRDIVRTELRTYNIDIRKYQYKADSVIFINKTYFKEAISGKLENKVKIITTPEKATYPRFDSYIKRFKIDDLYENINYDGGFSMRGAKIIGSGSEEENVYLYFFREGSLFLKATANFYVFNKKKIIGMNTAVVFYINNDSIFHPGITLTYLVDKKELNLSPTEGILSKSPYYNTFHKISMSFEQLTWQTSDTLIRLSKLRGSALGNAVFESMNYYNQIDFEEIQLRDEIHPLISIREFAKRIKSEEFYTPQFAKYMRSDISQIRQLLMRLSFNGFIFFDLTTDWIKINQRLYDYIDARFGKIDYDVMKFSSTVEAPMDNAIINLNNYNLNINGIPEIFLSDSQNVAIYPKYGQITMKKNRNFDFDGIIYAGLFTFFGKDFNFQYDNFKVDLNNIDSLKLKVQTKEQDMYGYLLKEVNNTIELISGDLLIDKPNNKSGLKDHPEYPIFNSKVNSFVYYDLPTVHNGIYKRDSFYFEIYPYTIDSLDNFNSKGLEFKGKFISAGILPVFEERIILQDDYSLGFKRTVPPSGYPVYEGRGHFAHEVTMNNKGLHGKGKIDYLTSTTYSDDFLFYPKQMKTWAQEFKIQSRSSGIQFPSVNGINNNINWLPYDNELNASYTDSAFIMMDHQAKLSGFLKLQPIGLTGSGTMVLDKARLKSKLYSYNTYNFSSDTADFELQTAGTKAYTFSTDNVNAHVDFIQRRGTFNSNDYYSQVEFKANLYIGFIDNFSWYMDESKLEMSIQNKGIALSKPQSKFEEDSIITELIDGAKYISVHPGQDRLSFVAPSATYNYRDNIINGHGVKLIRVADTYIYTSDGEVFVEEKAKMRTLFDAEIMANLTTKYHKFFNANVNIHGKKDYVASGNYTYLDQDYRAQNIHFSHIAVDDSIQTIASGEITEDQSFTISPYFPFMGKVNLEAKKKFLYFNGGTQLVHNCDTLGKDWLDFETEINPLDIYIPFPEKPKNSLYNKTYVSTFLTSDSVHVYSKFLGNRKNYSDRSLVTASGFLRYNEKSGKYKIGSKEKMLDQSLPGNFQSLYPDFCLFHSEGKIDIGLDFGQMKLSPVGSVNHDLSREEIKLNMMLPLDFLFSREAMTVFAADLNSNLHLRPIKANSKTIIKRLDELIGEVKRKEFLEQPKEEGVELKFPKELEYTILISDIKMKWNQETHSYRSYGKIGIGSIFNIPVNKYVEGHIEMTKKRSGNILNMFFKIDDNTWYYFNYFRSVMQSITTNGTYIGFIKALKAKKRKVKIKKRSGQIPYIYMLSTPNKMRKFVAEFLRIEEFQRMEKMAADSLLMDTIQENIMKLDSLNMDSLYKDIELPPLDSLGIDTTEPTDSIK